MTRVTQLIHDAGKYLLIFVYPLPTHPTHNFTHNNGGNLETLPGWPKKLQHNRPARSAGQWWPGDTRSQAISNKGINLILPEYSGFSTRRINCEYMYQSTTCNIRKLHDDVIKWKHFPRYWPFVRGIHQLPVNSPHKGQWHGALMFSLICVWINGWVNNR